METGQKFFQNFLPLPENQLPKIFFKNFLLAQKMRLEISGGPLGVKFRIQGHLGVGKGEKHPLGQNCPKADATVNINVTLESRTEQAKYKSRFYRIGSNTKMSKSRRNC